MSHKSEHNQKALPRRASNHSSNISNHFNYSAEKQEIEGKEGLQGNETRVIALIRKYPLLYDTSCPDFYDAKKRDQTWKAVAEVFNVSRREIRQFWESLRQSFLNYCDGNLDGNWKTHSSFFDEMHFLNFPKRNRGSAKPTEEETSDSSETDDLNDCNEFNELKTDGLIQKIQANPILYDRKHVDAKNHEQKLKTWKKIAKEVGIPVSQCVNQWKLLREKYGKERKYRKNNPDARTWYLYEKLSFLDPHAFKKKCSHTQMSKGILNDEIINSLREDLCSSSKSLVIDHKTQDKVSPNAKPNIKNELQMDMLSTRLFFNGKRDIHSLTGVLKDPPQDEDELFATTITNLLKKISNSDGKKKLKADIYSLINNFEKNND